MTSSVVNNDVLNSSFMKVAQVHAAIKDNVDIQRLEKILQRQGNINYEITNANNDKTNSASCSVLHLAYRYSRHEAFELLLNYGADFTAKCANDSHDRSVIRLIISDNDGDRELFSDESKNSYIDLALSAHVKFANHSNPCCSKGISHFHVACARNNTETVEFFLGNGIDANQAVNVDSSIFAGFTPLHFAVKYKCFETAEILLNYGGNVRLKNAVGMSPLDMLIEQRFNRKVWDSKDENMLELFAKHIINVNENDDNFDLSSFHVACMIENTSIIKSILENTTDLPIINRQVQMVSPMFPGYAPLHFAAISSVDAVKLLLDKGADIEVKNANNQTPFDLCLQTFSVEDIHNIISSQTRWKNITLSDNKTRLLDLVSAMTDVDAFCQFLAIFSSIADLNVPMDSPLWPGYTILHIAVVLSEKLRVKPESKSDMTIVEECLAQGADITRTDANSSTALHLAFYLQKISTVELLLKHHTTIENPPDSNNLSHFHIACAAGNESVVERFISKGVDVNIPIASTIEWTGPVGIRSSWELIHLFLTPGSTALHISVACGNAKIIKMLLDNGADVYAKDVYGFTAIHRLLTSRVMHHEDGIVRLLMATDGLHDSTAEGGLTHLHVACHFDAVDAAEKLLDSGADINAVVSYKSTTEFSKTKDLHIDLYGDPSKEPLSVLSRYSGYTPLHFSVCGLNGLAQSLLMKRGADMLVGNSHECVRKIIETARDGGEILQMLMNDDDLWSRLRSEFGLTPLHVACYLIKVGWVHKMLERGENVNAQVRENSLIGSGWSPMHFAASHASILFYEKTMAEICQSLLEYGADVRLKNEDGSTALHLLASRYAGLVTRCKYANSLLGSLKDFDVNEAHSQGTSFFHLACLLKNVLVVEGYLKNGIDVNRPVDFFADRYPGCSPLHLAAGYGSDDSAVQLQIVDLLLKHGADVLAKDAFENTVLHKAASIGSSRHILFDKFISGGVDVNAENVRGETALEKLINSDNASWEEVECLLNNGSRINSFDNGTEEGHVAKISNNEVLYKLMDSEYSVGVDHRGRTILHNLGSIRGVTRIDYAELIGRWMKRGGDIDHQDNEGNTALHTATRFENSRAAFGLLKNGADINVTDKKGKTAFVYSIEGYSALSPRDRRMIEFDYGQELTLGIFAMHVYKMEHCGLYASEEVKQLQIHALELIELDQNMVNEFDYDVRLSKHVDVGSTGLTLHDFCNVDVQKVYLSISLEDRDEIDQFFEDIHKYDTSELSYLLSIKYENAVKRIRLINRAVAPFITLIKNQLPDLCCRIILSFLSNSDLKNVIASEEL